MNSRWGFVKMLALSGHEKTTIFDFRCSCISLDSTKTNSVFKSDCTIVHVRLRDNVEDGKSFKSDYMMMFTMAGRRMARVKTRTRMEMPATNSV